MITTWLMMLMIKWCWWQPMLIIMIMWWGNCEFCQEFTLSSFPIKVVSGDNSLFWLMHCYEDADYKRDQEWVFSAPQKEIVILDPFQHNHHKAKAGLQPARPSRHLASRLRRSAQEGKVLIFRDTHRHFIIIYISQCKSYFRREGLPSCEKFSTKLVQLSCNLDLDDVT